MRCSDVDRLASAYIDGELDEARASALRGHLRTCAACLDMVEDLAAIVRAADGLDRLEPPASLWARVERGLADAEVADAHRSRLWLWWHGLRPHLLPASVAVAGAAALALWLVRGSPAEHRAAASPAPRAAHVEAAGAAGAAGMPASAETDESGEPGETFGDRRAREIAEADARYLGAIEELSAIAAELRPGWSDEVRRAFDDRLAEFEAAARRHRQALASAPQARPAGGEPEASSRRAKRRWGRGAAPDQRSAGPVSGAEREAIRRSRDALRAIYEAQLRLLQAAAIGGDDGAGLLSMAPAGSQPSPDAPAVEVAQ